MIRKKFYFDDVFADILLMHTLNHATFKGAETGECLAAAAKVVEGNAESWRRAWQEQGEKAERAGRMADDRGHGAEPERIQCPLLCLNDPTDQEELRRQAASAVEAAPNAASRHQVFAPEDGTVLYRQLDNFSLKHRVMFDWLDEVLDQR
jgi:hypothetical protein